MYFFKLGMYLAFCCGFCFLLQSAAVVQQVDQSGGARLFSIHCAVCHGRNGEGGKGPALAVPKLPRASTDEALFNIISDGIPGTEMPESVLEDVQIKQIVAYVRQLGRRPEELVSGNPSIGEQLYWGKGGCSRCHVLKGRGTAIGPDLADIGARRGSSYLRTSLTDPEKDVPTGATRYRPDVSISTNFLQVRLRTKTGQDIFGVRINEDTFSIQIRDFSGRTYSFFKSELAELDKQWGKSPMPGYRDVFTANELQDMVAFLASLRGDQ